MLAQEQSPSSPTRSRSAPAISVNQAPSRPPNDLSLAASRRRPGVKSVDPYDISIAMPAQDGEPVLSDADRDALGPSSASPTT